MCKIECDCCSESHYIILTKDKSDKSVYFELKEIGILFKSRLLHWLKMIFNWESFTNGKNRDFFQVLITRNMAKSLVDVLYKEGYTKSDIYFQEKVEDDMLVIFDCNKVLLSIDLHNKEKLLMSLYPAEYENRWKCAGGSGFAELDYNQISQMIFVIENFIGDKYGYYTVSERS